MARVGSPLAAPVTQLLVAWGQGEQQALEQLTPIVYKELRRLAQWHMNGERPGHTLQATALVNEAYLRLVDINRIQWQDRAHFFAMAARQMRRILIDAARKHGNQRRGGDAQKVSLAEGLVVPDRPEELVALDEVLIALTQIDERRGRVVEMKFFGGLSVDEIAEVLRVSPDTVKRDWKLAKAWLGRELRKTRAGPGWLGSRD
jgi:RNA polymerase sigma factor (TIGR02999 family)